MVGIRSGWVWVWGVWAGPGLVWMGCVAFATSLATYNIKGISREEPVFMTSEIKDFTNVNEITYVTKDEQYDLPVCEGYFDNVIIMSNMYVEKYMS
jgi:hypothetical protein